MLGYVFGCSLEIKGTLLIKLLTLVVYTLMKRNLKHSNLMDLAIVRKNYWRSLTFLRIKNLELLFLVLSS
jgi:hypothetical protein